MRVSEIDALLQPGKRKLAELKQPGETRFKFSEVQPGPELLRIRKLERRPIPDPQDPEHVELADFLTKRLWSPITGEAIYPGPLRATQALAVKEIWENKGGALMIKVGGGKTLTSALIPTVLQAEDALLLTKGDMVRGANEELAKYRKNGWNLLPAHKFRVMNYESISVPNAGELRADDGKTILRKALLNRLKPKVLILDEAHGAADSGSTTHKRIEAFLDEFPETIVVAMSGTFFKTSIKDGQKLLKWALKDRCPLPCDFNEREMWAGVLDAKRPDGVRSGFGALKFFLTEQEDETVRFLEDDYEGADARRSIFRRAVARRILETPGVIGTQDPPLPVKLKIDFIMPPSDDAGIVEAFRLLRGLGNEELPGWQLPNGMWIPDGIQAARHGTSLGYGVFNEWFPAPPDSYRFHASAWAKFCGRKLRFNARGVDSEQRCRDAVKRGFPGFEDEWTKLELFEAGKGIPKDVLMQLEGISRLDLWEAAQVEYKEKTGLNEPPSVGRWVSDECIEMTREWCEEHVGIIWVNSIPLGQRLAKELGLPYYGEKGIDAKTGRHITKHVPGTSAIASKPANGTGKNLQGIWHKNLWLCAPCEQSLGRTHRDGQKADTVYNWVYIGCFEHLRAFWNARDLKSDFQEDMQLSPQKLRYADVRMPSAVDLSRRANGDITSRWARPVSRKREEAAESSGAV